MDRVIELLLTSQTLQLVVIGVFLLIAAMLLIFFQYSIDKAKGRHAKFRWFKVNSVPPRSAKEEQTAPQPSITGKNINAGQNYGEIGDNYTELK